MIDRLSIFYLKLWDSPTFQKNKPLLQEYIRNFSEFLELFLLQRYSLLIDVTHYYTRYSPQTYEELQALDQKDWIQKKTGQHMQLYVTYGYRLQPHGYTDAAGYCECKKFGGSLVPADMMYVSMIEYEGIAKSPYAWYAEFSRLVTHELEHQVLRMQNHAQFVTAVHRAATKPRVKWDMRMKDRQDYDVIFTTQPSPLV